MKTITVASFLVITGCLLAAEKKRQLYPLTVREVFPQEYQKAASAVIVAVSKEGLKPREYSAEVKENENGKVLEFVLWHDSALEQREEPTVRGDPTGKCRTVLYDVTKEAVTRIYGWK